MRQTTIKSAIHCSGIGLHSGRKVTLRLHPAGADSGLSFLVHGESGAELFEPGPESVVGTGLATTLGVSGSVSTVSTVEHLMAALRGLGVDNCKVEVEGGELPIMDGSAGSYVFLVRQAGLVEQDAPRRFLRVARPFVLEDGAKRVAAEPHPEPGAFSVDYLIDFPHPLIGEQRMRFELTPESFIRRVAKARTFGFAKDVEMLRRRGLAKGGSLDNAVVLDEYGVVNEEGLRFKDEFVRHKVLDFIGDMALSRLPLSGAFTVAYSGHALNNAFLRGLTEPSAGLVEAWEAEAAPLAGGRATTTQQQGLLPGVEAIA